MIQNNQTFIKGINRRSSRDEAVNPEFFWTLQNCRIFNRGDTGKVTRIDGFQKFNNNTTDYTKILDILNFQDEYIIFYEDSVTTDLFHIDVYNQNGDVVFTDSYNGISTDHGEIHLSEETIFISPHNKILYYDNGTYILNDYVSNIPTISVALSGSAGSATGYIEPTSSVQASAGKVARGMIDVVNNNTSLGNTDSYQIEFDGVTTQSGDIEVTYQDSENQIAKKIYDALKATTLTTDWDFSMSKNTLDEKNDTSTNIYITSLTVGDVYNGITPTIVGSEFNINQSDGGTKISLLDFDGTTFNEDTGNSTIITSATSGGQDPIAGNYGPLYIRINKANETVQTENILSGDTITDVANKIENALNSEVSDKYNIRRVTNRVNIESIAGGKDQNSFISLSLKTPNHTDPGEAFTFTKSNLTGGTDANDDVTLDRDTNYWYKVCYRYIDGHKSYTCEPEYIFTGPANKVELTIDSPELDLDGTRPKIQVFRKKEFEDFYLVDEIDATGNTTVYVDNGKFKINKEEPQNNIWLKSHDTSDIADDVLVMGNILYNNEEYSNVDFDLSLVNTTDNKTLPQNTKARVFVQPKYSDGTTGYHTQIGEIDVTDDSKKLSITQNAAVTNTDKTVEELSFHLNYLKQAEEFTYDFNSVELANTNIPTIEDKTFYPQSTRIFFGFKYLEIIHDTGIINVFGWDTQRERIKHGGIDIGTIDDTGPIGSNNFPRKLTINIMGIDLEYVRHGVKVDGPLDSAVYKLGNYEALKKAVATGNLFVRLTGTNVNGLSDEFDDEELFEEKIKVNNLIDKSLSYPDLNLQTEQDKVLYGPRDTRLYLVLDESKLDSIDNLNINNYSLRQNYLEDDTPLSYDLAVGFPSKEEDFGSYNLSFELLNFKEKTSSSFTAYTGDGNGNDGGVETIGKFNQTYYSYANQWDYAVYQLTTIRDIEQEDSSIYIGNKDNTIGSVTLEVTGYEFEEDSVLKYSKLVPYNIYESLLFKKDLNLSKTKYKNQIVWTDKLTKGNSFAGGRTIKAENIFNVSSDHGEILNIMSLNKNLFVFCEKGIALLLLGETLTQSSQGGVTVNSSNFIGDSWWIRDNLNNIKKDSILKIENVIYFTDGYDVFQIQGRQIQNISQGAVPLEVDHEYSAINDNQKKEYILADKTNGETWVFNYSFNQWYGPHTFTPKKGTNYNQHVIGCVGNELVEFNTGNTFSGQAFNVLVESVANDTDVSFYDKHYRKFYIETNNDSTTTFSYGKDYNNLVDKQISNMIVKNTYKHQGIAPSEQNSKVIFWEIESPDVGFELNDLAYSFQPNKRR